MSLRSPWLRATPNADTQADRRARDLRAETVSTGVAVTPSAGTVALTGYAPGIAQPQAVTPSAGTVALTGYAPAITQPQVVTPGAGALALTGYTPALLQPQGVTAGVGTLTLTGYTPALLQPQAVTAGAGTVALTGHAPTALQGVGINPAAGSITLTGYTPALLQPQAVTAGAGTLVLVGYAPSVAIHARTYAPLPPEIWLQTLLNNVWTAPPQMEILRVETQMDEKVTSMSVERQIATISAGVVTVAGQPEFKGVMVVPDSYLMTKAEDVYVHTPELVL